MTSRSKTVAQGGFSRRRFLQTSAAAGVLASAGGLILPQSARAQQKRGGHFRAAIGHGSTSDTLNPGLWENDFVIGMGYAYCGYLTGDLEGLYFSRFKVLRR